MNKIERFTFSFVFFGFLLTGGLVIWSTDYQAWFKSSETEPASEFLNPDIESINLSNKTAWAEINQKESSANSYWRPLLVAKKQFIKAKQDFVEINFSDQVVRLYKQGVITEEIKILAVGDPQGWGGTPAGLYSLTNKNEKAFSVSADVYMPYAIQFYGKYYIHGEPYDKVGRKIISTVSGGCVRLQDEDAKKLFTQIENNWPVLVIDKDYEDRKLAKEGNTMPNLSASAFAILDLDSGLVLGEKQATQIFPIASITKLMTALVVAENVDLRKGVYATESMLSAYGQTAGLLVGNYYQIVDLFYPLLTESSNDSAEVLTGLLGRNRTINLMNTKAKHLLMTDTKFYDPSGFDVNNQSTAKDLTFLARYLYNNRQPILDITKGDKVTTFGPQQFDVNFLKNKNAFNQTTGFAGGKTGFLIEAKNTGLFIFNLKDKDGNEIPVVISILQSDRLTKDTEKLLAWLEGEYGLKR